MVVSASEDQQARSEKRQRPTELTNILLSCFIIDSIAQVKCLQQSYLPSCVLMLLQDNNYHFWQLNILIFFLLFPSKFYNTNDIHVHVMYIFKREYLS